MSNGLINDDQTVARDRKNPLKDVPEEGVVIEVSKRDQISRRLLKKAKELKLGQKVVEMWETANADRADWLSRQQMILQDYDEFYESTAEGPFEQASSLHLPTTFIVIKTMHARFLQALLGVDPPFQAKPRNEASVQRAEMVQDLLRYMIEHDMNERQGAFDTVDPWLWQWLTTGSGFIKPYWKRKFIRYEDVVEVVVEGPPEIFIDAEGNEVVKPTQVIEEQEVMKTEKLWEGIQLDYIFPEDVVVVGGKGNPQNADAVIQREPVTASYMWEMVDQNIFNKDAVEAAIESGYNPEATDHAGAIKQQRKMNSGESITDSPVQLDKYDILEAYIKADVDGSGINCDLVLWVHKDSKEIIRATYLHRINKNGKIPIKKIDFLRRPGQEYGMGLAEILHPLSVEIDAMHNMRIDFGMLSTMPYGFYRPTSSIDPDTIQLEPGALIPVEDPQRDVYFPNLGNRTSFGAQEEAALGTIVERLTGVSDLSLGVLSGNQGATRTATGTRALVGEMSANLDVFLRRLNMGWKQVLEHCLDLVQQRIPVGYCYRVTGKAESAFWNQVRDREEIRGNFDIEVSPNSTSSNQQILEQRANELIQVTANPLDIQLGIITPLERYNALINWYKVRGIKEVSQYAKKPAGMIRMMTPEEEANRLLRGIEVPVDMNSDHQGFLAYFQNIMGDEELLGQFDENEVVLLQGQAQRHQQMQQALQQAQAQQANQQQIQQNASMGEQVASPGGNPMGGLVG